MTDYSPEEKTEMSELETLKQQLGSDYDEAVRIGTLRFQAKRQAAGDVYFGTEETEEEEIPEEQNTEVDRAADLIAEQLEKDYLAKK